ncbi:MAG: T9SS type A sorting domain-containing protein [Bacteroidales bacterium]|nr:T9SS type A sorting domain-containing protein [Bacteroidales bacterium]
MKKVYSLILLALFVCNVATAQKTDILTEGFETAALPNGWTYEYGAGDNDNWIYQTGGANGGAYPETAHTGTYNACFRGFPIPSVTKLVTPALDLSNGGILNFWWASSTYFGGTEIDLLTVFYREGSTGSWIELASYPDGADEWTEETFSIPTNSNEVYFAFEGSYQGGLGVCLDDVHVYTSDTDLGISEVLPLIAYGVETYPTVTIQNFGLVEAENYQVNLVINGTAYNQTISTAPNIAAGDQIEIEFPYWTLPAEGTYAITATVTIADDAVASNNTKTVNCIVDQTPMGNVIYYFDADFGASQNYHCAYPETDGQYIYVAKWYTNKFARFSMNGTQIGDYFTIENVTADDIAFDGDYFYAATNNKIAKMDFSIGNEIFIDTIETSTNVNSLTFSENSNTFWGNYNNNPIIEINTDGTLTGSNFSPIGSPYVNSLAIDEYTDPSNPKIWIFEAGASNVIYKLTEYYLNGNPTGHEIILNSTQYPGIITNSDQTGGLACYVNEQNQVILLVGIQHLADEYSGRILYIYLGEAETTYETVITVVNNNEQPIQGVEVNINSTKYSATTDAYGQVTFQLANNNYNFSVSKDCFENFNGNFTIAGASPSIDNVVLNQVDAPIFLNGIVQNNGQTIELTFNEEIDLNGETAPAGFSVYANENLTINSVTANQNIVSLSINEIIEANTTVTISYSNATVQSTTCNVLLEDIFNVEITNNSTVDIQSNINNKIKIYPNPTNSVVYIQSDILKIETIIVSDISGKIIPIELKNNHNLTYIDFSNFEPGIYFIKINSKIFSKIIKR